MTVTWTEIDRSTPQNKHMTPNEIDAFLRETLADRRISASEKKQVADWLAPIVGDEQKLAFIRSRAFALAREELPDAVVLDWLEGIVKLTLKNRAAETEAAQPANAFFSPGDACIHEVIRQFNSARQRCDICVFTITDDRITSAIQEAHRRGVAIRIITDDDKSLDAGSDIDRLKSDGIPCVQDHSPAHMHHKFALFDGVRLLTGSFNWTRSATEQNEENLIVTADARLVAAFVGRFEQLWVQLQRHG
jgi:phosphatidylserine/phosphatidylglycerophosphate/cardiolipin synthase-like enzyme